MSLLPGHDVRFAGCFCGMHRALRMRSALEATVHSATWCKLKNLKATYHQAAKTIKNDLFWKRLHLEEMEHQTFSALRQDLTIQT